MRRPLVEIAALVMLALACAVPTEAPNWDMTWNVPVPDKNGVSINVNSFLPSGVTTVGTPPTAFSAAIGAAASISRTLGQVCPGCAAINGLNAPKPAFTVTPPAATASLTAASKLSSATLAAGSQISLRIVNGFNFDPIRPNGGNCAPGPCAMTITVTNGGATLGTLTLDGTKITDSLPASATRTKILALSGTISGSSPISVTMTLRSPAGSNTTINMAQTFAVTATPTVVISTATVNLAAQTVHGPTTPIDLSNVDSTITNRIQNDAQTRGSMFLTITNPFTLGGALNLEFTSATGTPANEMISPITKSVTLTAAANATTPNVSTVTINLTGQELRRILGRKVQVAFGGSTAAGTLTVTPTQKVSVTSRLELTFNIKEQ